MSTTVIRTPVEAAPPESRSLSVRVARHHRTLRRRLERRQPEVRRERHRPRQHHPRPTADLGRTRGGNQILTHENHHASWPVDAKRIVFATPSEIPESRPLRCVVHALWFWWALVSTCAARHTRRASSHQDLPRRKTGVSAERIGPAQGFGPAPEGLFVGADRPAKSSRIDPRRRSHRLRPADRHHRVRRRPDQPDRQSGTGHQRNRDRRRSPGSAQRADHVPEGRQHRRVRQRRAARTGVRDRQHVARHGRQAQEHRLRRRQGHRDDRR